jgi:peroxiredoxin
LRWQRPNGPAWREVVERGFAGSWPAGARTGVALRLGLAAAALAAGLASQAEPSYPLIGRMGPDFALHAVAGGNVRLSEHRGEVVVLSFWSSRCNPCRAQLAALNRSLATYRSAGLEIYGIGVDDDPGRSLEYARSLTVGFVLLLDPAKQVSRSYQVDNLPMTVLIDRGGTVRHALRDYTAASDGVFLQQLRDLLNE